VKRTKIQFKFESLAKLSLQKLVVEYTFANTIKTVLSKPVNRWKQVKASDLLEMNQEDEQLEVNREDEASDQLEVNREEHQLSDRTFRISVTLVEYCTSHNVSHCEAPKSIQHLIINVSMKVVCVCVCVCSSVLYTLGYFLQTTVFHSHLALLQITVFHWQHSYCESHRIQTSTSLLSHGATGRKE